jgi:hypothetical protein
MKDFRLVSNFRGYINKKDITNAGAGFMAPGSQNVIINDGEKIESRQGYTLDGAAQTGLYPIRSSYVWKSSTGTEFPMRYFDDTLQWRYINSDGDPVWTDLLTGLSTTELMDFTTWWNTGEVLDELIFVNNDSNVYRWSGGVTTFASATATTITKEGTTTWAEDRFLQTANKTITIDGIDYTYTGGEGTTTLTGISPDPTLGGHAVGSVIYHQVVTETNKPGSGSKNALCENFNNQVWYGDTRSRDINVSKNSNPVDFAFSSPRLPGEGALLTLDSPPAAFVVQEDEMYISGTRDDWYQSRFELSSDLVNESIFIDRLKTAEQQGAQGQGAVGKIKNDVVFISNEPTLDQLGRLKDIVTTQSKNISDPVKALFDRLDFTNVHVVYHRDQINIAVPNESLWLIFDLSKGYWFPPQVVPFRRFAIIDGELYAHSSTVNETYKLYDGYSDNGAPIQAIATMVYRNFGLRAWQKKFDEWYTEGYISSNTDMTMTLRYEYEGAETVKEFSIAGDDDQIVLSGVADPSLGKEQLGGEPLGTFTDEISDLSKFRVIHTTKSEDFYEVQVEYESNDQDQRWQLLAIGPNAIISPSDNNHIKQ